MKYLLNTKNPYQIKVGDTIVEMEYLDTNKTFNKSMLNILKQKYKKNWQIKKSTLNYTKGGGKKIMAGRKSKYSSTENNTTKNKIWSVALYIRLSQEDEDNR